MRASQMALAYAASVLVICAQSVTATPEFPSNSQHISYNSSLTHLSIPWEFERPFLFSLGPHHFTHLAHFARLAYLAHLAHQAGSVV